MTAGGGRRASLPWRCRAHVPRALSPHPRLPLSRPPTPRTCHRNGGALLAGHDAGGDALHQRHAEHPPAGGREGGSANQTGKDAWLMGQARRWQSKALAELGAWAGRRAGQQLRHRPAPPTCHARPASQPAMRAVPALCTPCEQLSIAKLPWAWSTHRSTVKLKARYMRCWPMASRMTYRICTNCCSTSVSRAPDRLCHTAGPGGGAAVGQELGCAVWSVFVELNSGGCLATVAKQAAAASRQPAPLKLPSRRMHSRPR